MSREDRDRWNARFAGEAPVMGEGPNALAAELAQALPTEGRALEIACGEGQLAVWLATRGLRVDAVDIASAGLAKVRRHAAAAGVSGAVRTFEHDLDLGLPAVEPGYALITCFHFHAPRLFPAMRALLAPGGMLLVEVLTRARAATTAEPAAPPVSEAFLAPRGSLLEHAGDLVVHLYREGILRGRGQAQLLAQRPPASDVLLDR